MSDSASPISYPAPPPPRVLSFAKPSAVVWIKNSVDKIEPMYVLSRCDREASLYCVTCQIAIANTGNLEMHVEGGGTHEFIRWCRRHGTPEGPDAHDVERVARFQQLESGL